MEEIFKKIKTFLSNFNSKNLKSDFKTVESFIILLEKQKDFSEISRSKRVESERKKRLFHRWDERKTAEIKFDFIPLKFPF